jgi:hypothetical protein
MMETHIDPDTRTGSDLFPKRLRFQQTSANMFDMNWHGKIER